MQISQLKRPSAWNALLWKDLNQVRDIVLAVVLGVGAIQLVMLIVGLNLSQTIARESTFSGIAVIGFISPFLAALGCSGMLVGHERQVGTWNWSSGLPISWRQSLASKLLVSFLVCSSVFLCLEIAPLALVFTNNLHVPSATGVIVYALGFTFIGILEVLCVYFLSSLIFKDTLTGMVVATFGLGFGHAFLLTITLAINQSPFTDYAAGWGVALAITSLAAITTAFVFRWRWYSGQLSTVPRFAPAITSARALPRYARENASQPTAWWSTMRLSLANNLGLRILILIGYLVILAMTFSDRLIEQSIVFVVMVFAVIAVALLGITTFAGDQTLGRFRFLADRGVSPWRMATSRLCVAGALAFLVVMVTVAAVPSQTYLAKNASILTAAFAAIALVTFSVAALASLCFRQTVVAATTCIVLAMGSYAATLGSLNTAIELFVHTMLHDEVLADFAWPTIYAGTLSAAMAIAGVFWLIPKWIQRDDHKLAVHFWWIALFALTSPAAISLNTAFLRVPYVAWPELTLEQAMATYPAVPQAFEGEFPTQRFVPNLAAGPEMSTWAEQEQFINEIATEWDTSQVESVLSSLELWFEAPAVTQENRTRNATRLGKLALETALLAKFAVLEQKPELAIRLLKAHRELQRLATQVALIETQNDRRVAVQILASFSAENVQALGGLEVFEDLLPIQVQEEPMYVLRNRADATIIRARLRGEKLGVNESLYDQVPYIPITPLRWYVERKMALSTQDGNEEKYWANQTSANAFTQLRNRIEVIRSQMATPEIP